MNPFEVIGKLYVDLANKQEQLLTAIKVLGMLKSGELTLDHLHVTDTSFTVATPEGAMEAPDPEGE